MNRFYSRFIDMTVDKFSKKEDVNIVRAKAPDNTIYYSFATLHSHLDNKAHKKIAIEHLAEDLENHFHKKQKLKMTGEISGIVMFCSGWITQTMNLTPTEEELKTVYESCFNHFGLGFMLKTLDETKGHYVPVLLSSEQSNEKLKRILFFGQFTTLKKFNLESSLLKNPLLDFLEHHKDDLYDSPNLKHKEELVLDTVKTIFPPSQWKEFNPYFKNLTVQTQGNIELFCDSDNPMAQVELNYAYLTNNYHYFPTQKEIKWMAKMVELAFTHRLDIFNLSSFSLSEKKIDSIGFIAQSRDEKSVDKHLLKLCIFSLLKHYEEDMTQEQMIITIDAARLDYLLPQKDKQHQKKLKI